MTLNDLSSKTFDVYADVGPSFTSQKQQTREELKDLLAGTSEGTPTHNLLLMKYLGLMDGAGFDDVRDYARNELIMMGVQDPETDEEKQAYAAAQENQQEDPNLLIGQAEMMKGQAALLDKEIDKFNAETNRMRVMIEAEKTGVDITKTEVETFGKQIENAQKLLSPAP